MWEPLAGCLALSGHPHMVLTVALPMHLLNAYLSQELGGSDVSTTRRLCELAFYCWQNKLAYNHINVFSQSFCKPEV